MRMRLLRVLLPLLVIALQALAGEAGAAEATSELAQRIDDLRGPNALAEWHASRKLVAAGDKAVDLLAALASAEGPIAPRLAAIELLGEIGTKAAREALVGLLRWEEKNLAVRGQLCMQVGYLREASAVPVIAEWLEKIGPQSLHDVGGPKEAQPSTCYMRHVEALWLIGDERAIPILEAFEQKIPRNLGFLSNFVTGGTSNALEELKATAAFWREVRKQAGLEAAIAPLFEHLRSDPVARFRHHESEVVRCTAWGTAILAELTHHASPAVVRSAEKLLARYQTLKP